MTAAAARPRVAVVTGGSRGIGRAICERLAVGGAHVLVGASSDANAAATASDLRSLGAAAESFGGDIAAEGVADSMAERAVELWGGLDIWVNNAAMIAVGEITQTTVADWDRVIAVNLRGTFLGCRAAARTMKAVGRGGRIVNASSVSGRRGGPLTGVYAASKAGVIGLTQSLAAEVAADGITVNAYCPGNVTSTAMWQTVDTGIAALRGTSPGTAMAESVAAQAIARPGTEHEIAAVVEFLTSEDASFVTGACYVVDGGALRY